MGVRQGVGDELGPPRRRSPAANRVYFERWSEQYQEPAAQLIAAAYLGHVDSRINDQYRICFVWRDHDAYEVEVTDYH